MYKIFKFLSIIFIKKNINKFICCKDCKTHNLCLLDEYCFKKN